MGFWPDFPAIQTIVTAEDHNKLSDIWTNLDILSTGTIWTFHKGDIVDEEEKKEVARIKLKAGAEITLRPKEKLDGLVMTVRMQDPRDPRSFMMLLDPEAITELGATLVGYQVGESLKPLGDLLKKHLEDDKEGEDG